MIKKIAYACAFTCIAGIIILILYFHNTKGIIRKGIEREIAVEKCMEDENYHLVKFSGYNTGLTYIISEGEDKGVEVELEGITPSTSLSDVFYWSDNEFLVYGLEKNTDKKTTNACSMEYIIEPYTIVVENWEIVVPIYRDYTYSRNERIFYPKRYLDNYDLEHGDYKVIDESDIRKVRCNGNDVLYIKQHRSLTVEDLEDIEQGITMSDIKGKIGKPDSWIWDTETGIRNPIYVFDDGLVAVCYLSKEGGNSRYLEKIVIYDGDIIEQVLKE